MKDRFSTYIYDQVEQTTPALPESAMEFDKHAIPEFVIDKQFYRINRLPTIAIEEAGGEKDGQGRRARTGVRGPPVRASTLGSSGTPTRARRGSTSSPNPNPERSQGDVIQGSNWY